MRAESAPVIQIGKNGLTETGIAHIARILEQKKVVRVRFLRSFSAREKMKEIAEQLARAAGAASSSVAGFVVTLYK